MDKLNWEKSYCAMAVDYCGVHFEITEHENYDGYLLVWDTTFSRLWGIFPITDLIDIENMCSFLDIEAAEAFIKNNAEKFKELKEYE